MPRGEIDISDIQDLIDSKVPESERVEFKETLPAKKGNIDPWISGGNIGDKAKNQILEEAVAFANAHGGALVLGIKESESKPPVATDISPIPRCTELAERLKLIFRDCVEPQLTVLDIFAVPKDGDSGVVVIRVGRSRNAPHRVSKTLVCPIRRSDRCEEMSMREIQDMTLNVSRGLERLDKRLAKRSERFKDEFKILETPEDAFGFRMSAAPVGDEIRFDRVFHQRRIKVEFDSPWYPVEYGNNGNKREYNYPDEWPPQYWQPILRGARSVLGTDFPGQPYNCYKELHCDGLVEMGHFSVGSIFRKWCLPPDWFIVMFANLAVWADHIRKQAEAPTSEYAIEVEIRTLENTEIHVGQNGSRSNAMFSGASGLEELFPKLYDLKFPRYSLGESQDIPKLLVSFHRDFWNSLRQDVGTEEPAITIKGWPA